jgi:hypothetical protein
MWTHKDNLQYIGMHHDQMKIMYSILEVYLVHTKIMYNILEKVEHVQREWTLHPWTIVKQSGQCNGEQSTY